MNYKYLHEVDPGLTSALIKNNQGDPFENMDVKKLEELQQLEILSRSMKTIPEIVTELKLESISLVGQGLGLAGVHNLFKIPTLKSIRLKNFNLGQLEEVNCSDSLLEKIYFFDCKVEVFPDMITTIQNLKELAIAGGQITSIPTELKNCTKLKKLVLDNNKISDIPNVIHQLAQLNYLSLDNNPLTPNAKQQLRERFNQWAS